MRNIVRMLLWMSSLIRASVIELSMMKTDILKRSYMAEIMVYPNTIQRCGTILGINQGVGEIFNGEHGEHVHEFTWIPGEKHPREITRELTDLERIQYADIIKEGRR